MVNHASPKCFNCLKSVGRIWYLSLTILNLWESFSYTLGGAEIYFFHSGLHFIIIWIFILQIAFHLDLHFLFFLVFIFFSFGSSSLRMVTYCWSKFFSKINGRNPRKHWTTMCEQKGSRDSEISFKIDGGNNSKSTKMNTLREIQKKWRKKQNSNEQLKKNDKKMKIQMNN